MLRSSLSAIASSHRSLHSLRSIPDLSEHYGGTSYRCAQVGPAAPAAHLTALAWECPAAVEIRRSGKACTSCRYESSLIFATTSGILVSFLPLFLNPDKWLRTFTEAHFIRVACRLLPVTASRPSYPQSIHKSHRRKSSRIFRKFITPYPSNTYQTKYPNKSPENSLRIEGRVFFVLPDPGDEALADGALASGYDNRAGLVTGHVI